MSDEVRTDSAGTESSGEHSSSRPESLATLLGGRRSAIDASLPPVVFVAGWLLAGHSIGVGALAAIVVGALVAVWRLRAGDRPRAVVVSILAVVVAALLALYTGRAADFFLVQLLSNVASALAWITSIAIRWPLLGVIVGTVLGQRTRWRRDPGLLRAYGHASWVWVGQYAVRILVFLPLWWFDSVVGLGVARLVLSWPLIVVCLGGSWWVFQRALPDGHPGIRHPREAG